MIRRGYTRLKLQCMIWWWQLECNDAWTLLLVTKLGWSVKIKSIQEELFLWICVGSLIIWWKPFDVFNEKSFVSSNDSMSLDHQEVDLVLKSPSMTETDGWRVLMSDKRCSKFVLTGRVMKTWYNYIFVLIIWF